jgi:PiT family inorganic phosphate transporter
MIISLALLFEFINGFHDVANVVATPIASRALSPSQAIILAAIFNFVGAFTGTAVASTISKGVIEFNAVTDLVLISALLSSITWNIFTWYFGVPSSSSHALIGGLVGAAIAFKGVKIIHTNTIIVKVIFPMLISPILAFFTSFILIITILVIASKFTRVKKINSLIREFQVISTTFLAMSHGSNDTQKTISIVTLALLNFNLLPQSSGIPLWVILICASTMAMGTLTGGMRIVKTLTTKLSQLGPASSISAELSSGLLIFLASSFGLPVSTTQAAAGSIIGACYVKV